MTKTKFTATCPLTGVTRTRTSAHPYTHALTIKLTPLKTAIQGTFIRLGTNNNMIPKGYVLNRRTTKNVWGSACKVIEIPIEEQKTEIMSLVSFHASAELAISASRQFEHCGFFKVEAIPVPCTPV